MGLAITVTRLEHTAAELRSLAKGLDGASRAQAAALCGMDRQTLRDWVHRFNTHGVEGLSNKTAPGRSPALSDEQIAGAAADRADRA